MVKDLVKNLCVSLETDIGGVSGATSRKVVVSTPVITLTGNSVTITCDTTGATIYYTLDGSTPTSSSTQYSAAFTLDSSCTIKAIAIKGGKSSAVAEESYVKPVTYLTQWVIVGNSEVHGQEIWSCGEYNATDGKWHILVQPLGGSIADIALTEPLRKVDDEADTIEFPSNAEGKALVTRNIANYLLSSTPNWLRWTTSVSEKRRYVSSNNPLADATLPPNNNTAAVGLCSIYNIISVSSAYSTTMGISVELNGKISVYDVDYAENETNDAFVEHIQGAELLYQLATPTTELVDAPQIAEAESYTMVISQGAKAVEWSSFSTD